MITKNLADELLKIRSMDLKEAMSEETAGGISKTIESLAECASIAQKAILERLDEETLVKMILMIQKCTTVQTVLEGNRSILLADIEGSLQSYTQTVVLAVIGALIQDEIL